MIRRGPLTSVWWGRSGWRAALGLGAAVKLGGKVLGKVLRRTAEAAESEVTGQVMHLMCVRVAGK